SRPSPSASAPLRPRAASSSPPGSHYGRDAAVRARRAEVLTDAYAEHPERFVRKPPEPPALPAVVWISEPKEDELRHSDS
ncbi:MAG: hypothetical protein LC799_21085, partial [Actinobacteria bacterium]|nr:hypothetical protein [Actinomycetota bacterium]